MSCSAVLTPLVPSVGIQMGKECCDQDGAIDMNDCEEQRLAVASRRKHVQQASRILSTPTAASLVHCCIMFSAQRVTISALHCSENCKLVVFN